MTDSEVVVQMAEGAMGWPQAFAIAAVALAIGWILTTMFKHG